MRWSFFHSLSLFNFSLCSIWHENSSLSPLGGQTTAFQCFTSFRQVTPLLFQIRHMCAWRHADIRVHVGSHSPKPHANFFVRLRCVCSCLHRTSGFVRYFCVDAIPRSHNSAHKMGMNDPSCNYIWGVLDAFVVLKPRLASMIPMPIMMMVMTVWSVMLW